MSSFKRRVQSQQTVPIKGTQSVIGAPSLLQVSIGVPSIDDLLGGGLPLGHVLLVLSPDHNSAWGELVSHYFVAQGLSTQHRVQVCDPQADRFVSGCMWYPGTTKANVANAGHEDARAGIEGEAPDDKVKIAWRYEQMKQFKTTVDELNTRSEDYCHTFDLASTIPSAYVTKAVDTGRISYFNPLSENGHSPFDRCLSQLTSILETKESGESVPLRICINNLGSYHWGEAESHIICQFLLRLRSLVRSTNACVLITLPSHLSNSTHAPGWISKLGHLSDGCLTFQGIAADPVLGPTFPSYSGLLTVHTTPSPHTLLDASRRFSQLRGLNSVSSIAGTGGGENNLAFKCMRKRLVVETLHLDVEGGVGERRTTPSASAAVDSNPHIAHEEIKDEVQLARIVIDTPPERLLETTLPAADKTTSKKTPKKVAFKSAESDLYDF